MIEPTTRSALGDHMDRVVRSLNGRKDVTKTGPTPIQHIHPVTENCQSFILTTYRAPDERGVFGDTVTVEFVGSEGSVRLVLPPPVTACIARHRDALTVKGRRLRGKQQADARKAAGIQPAFLKPKPKKRGTAK